MCETVAFFHKADQWKSKPLLRAIIFDVDGTLAETEELHRASFNTAFKQFGFAWQWDFETYGKLLTTTGGKERIARYAKETDASLAADVILAMHKAKNELYAKAIEAGSLSLRPGVHDVMSKATQRKIKLGIATTTSKSNLDALLRSCFSEKERTGFAAIVCGEDVSRKKPDPEVYLKCLAQLGIRCDEAVAIEDSAVGLASAKAAQLSTIITPSAYTLTDDFNGALAVLPDLSRGLKQILAHFKTA